MRVFQISTTTPQERVDLKRDANPQVVLNQLYSFTQLQTTFGVIQLALVDGVPRVLTLKEMLEHYIDHQVNVVTRRTEFDLKKAKERQHILEALLKALDFIDEVINILRASKSIAEGKERLMVRFGFDEIQANHIVQMRLGQLTGLEREKLEDEERMLEEKIARFLEILSSRENVLALVKEEATVIRDKFSDDRRSEIVNVTGEMDIEDLIPEEDCVFTMTQMGYIKRMSVDEYQLQKKGGKGRIGITRREEDVVDTMFTASTHSHIMFFTTKGKAYMVKGYEIPEGSRTSKGMNLVNILPIESDEKVTAMIMIPKEHDDLFLCMITKNGIIKRTELENFRNIRKNGIIAINLDEGDVLQKVLLTTGTQDLFVATKKGLGIRFNETDARVIGRTARGVKALTFKYEDDFVVGMEILDEESGGKLLTVSEWGNGRKSDFSDYHVQSRGGYGSINYRVDKYGDVAAIKVVYDDDDVILISEQGIIIRIASESIRECARPSKGVRLMKLSESDSVITLTLAKKSGEETDLPDEAQAEDGAEEAPAAEETSEAAEAAAGTAEAES